MNVIVEGQPAAGKIQALVPLPESLGALRELASPFTAAWVIVPNTSGTLEPGERALSPDLPVAPLANVPTPALKSDDPKSKTLDAGARDTSSDPQRIRRGREGARDRPSRSRARAGYRCLRPTDALITSTSVPLVAGTLIRFNGAGGGRLETTALDPSLSGATADVTPPRSARSSTTALLRSRPHRPAPGSAVPKARANPAGAVEAPRPAVNPATNAPFLRSEEP